MTAARQRPACFGRRVTAASSREEHLVDADREVGLELPGKEVELRRAALHEEDLDGPLDGGGPDPGQAQTPTARSSAVIPRAAARITVSCKKALAEVRGRAGGRRRGHEHALPPPRLHVSAPLQVLDDARDRIRVDAEEAGQLPDAGQRLVPRDAAALDDVLELLRQLAPDRDRTVHIHPQLHGDLSTVI